MKQKQSEFCERLSESFSSVIYFFSNSIEVPSLVCDFHSGLLQYLQIVAKYFMQLLHKSNRQYDTSTVYAFLWRIAFQRFKFGKFVDTGSSTHYYIFIRRGRFHDIGSCIYLLNEPQLLTRRKKHVQASCF